MCSSSLLFTQGQSYRAHGGDNSTRRKARGPGWLKHGLPRPPSRSARRPTQHRSLPALREAARGWGCSLAARPRGACTLLLPPKLQKLGAGRERRRAALTAPRDRRRAASRAAGCGRRRAAPAPGRLVPACCCKCCGERCPASARGASPPGRHGAGLRGKLMNA